MGSPSKTQLLSFSDTSTTSYYSLASNAFKNCSSVSSITINNVTAINSSAFIGCSSLTAISCPNITGGFSFQSNLVIANNKLNSCTNPNIVSADLPITVTNIVASAFNGCSKMTFISMPGVTSSGIGATTTFAGCTAVTSVTADYTSFLISSVSYKITALFPNMTTFTYTGTAIGSDLANNTTLRTISIPYVTTTGISSGAFTECSNLTSVTSKYTNYTISGTATKIGQVFPNMTTFTYTGTSIGSDLANNTTLRTISIPNVTTTGISSDAFTGCSNLTSVTSKYTNYTISGTATKIGKVFLNMTTFNYIGTPDDLGSNLVGNIKLISVYIQNISSDNISSIIGGAFTKCNNLTFVTYGIDIQTLDTTTGLVIFNNVVNSCINKTGVTSIAIPNTVTNIDASAFYGCTQLQSVTIPTSVVVINHEAFNSCSNLSSIAIQGNPNTLDYNIFTNCPSNLVVATTSPTVLNYLQLNYPQYYSQSVSCFKEDTLILTDKGYIKIQDLQKGTMIKTMDGSYKALEILSTRNIYHHALTPRIIHQLYRYSKKDYPELVEDLIITGYHAVLVENYKNDEERKTSLEMVTEEECKVDNKYKLPAYADARSHVYEEKGFHNVYHVALENPDVRGKYGIYANGMLVESRSKHDMFHGEKMDLLF